MRFTVFPFFHCDCLLICFLNEMPEYCRVCVFCYFDAMSLCVNKDIASSTSGSIMHTRNMYTSYAEKPTKLFICRYAHNS